MKKWPIRKYIWIGFVVIASVAWSYFANTKGYTDEQYKEGSVYFIALVLFILFIDFLVSRMMWGKNKRSILGYNHKKLPTLPATGLAIVTLVGVFALYMGLFDPENTGITGVLLTMTFLTALAVLVYFFYFRSLQQRLRTSKDPEDIKRFIMWRNKRLPLTRLTIFLFIAITPLIILDVAVLLLFFGVLP